MNHRGTVATKKPEKNIVGKIEAPGTMFVTLNFSNPKQGGSTKKRKRLSADRKRETL